jgi:cytochrome b561
MSLEKNIVPDMTTLAAAPQRYDRRTIALHWTTAALVVLAWGMAQIIDFFPSGWPRVDARSVHMTLGILLGIVVILRISNRAGPGRSLPPVDTGLMLVAERTVHVALYVLMIAQVILGISLVYARHDSVFNLFTLPGQRNHDLAETIDGIHNTVAYVILGVAGCHALAALAHHYVWKDGVLRRMIPWL